MKTKKNNVGASAPETKLDYTPLTLGEVKTVMERAIDENVSDTTLADEIEARYEIEVSDDPEGTAFVQYPAYSAWEADVFTAAVLGAAAAGGMFAEEATEWRDEIEVSIKGESHARRLVSVFLANRDYMDAKGGAK